jgi:hypothetical protein
VNTLKKKKKLFKLTVIVGDADLRGDTKAAEDPKVK